MFIIIIYLNKYINYIYFVVTGFLVRNENLLKYELAKRQPDLMEYINWSKSNIGFSQNGITGAFFTRIKFHNSRYIINFLNDFFFFFNL